MHRSRHLLRRCASCLSRKDCASPFKKWSASIPCQGTSCKGMLSVSLGKNCALRFCRSWCAHCALSVSLEKMCCLSFLAMVCFLARPRRLLRIFVSLEMIVLSVSLGKIALSVSLQTFRPLSVCLETLNPKNRPSVPFWQCSVSFPGQGACCKGALCISFAP